MKPHRYDAINYSGKFLFLNLCADRCYKQYIGIPFEFLLPRQCIKCILHFHFLSWNYWASIVFFATAMCSLIFSFKTVLFIFRNCSFVNSSALFSSKHQGYLTFIVKEDATVNLEKINANLGLKNFVCH